MTWLTIIFTKRQGLRPGQVQNEFCIGYRHVSWLSALPLASKGDKGTLVFLHQRNFNKNFKEESCKFSEICVKGVFDGMISFKKILYL